MISRFLALTMFFGLSLAAHAQDYGITLGVHQTTASTSTDGLSTTGDFNFKIGFAASFPLTGEWAFRTGIIYDQRHFDINTSFNTLTAKLDYIDIPLMAQYNFTSMFGVFGGLVAAINVGNSVSGANNSSSINGVTGFIPLAQVGINGTFNNQFGIEVYYERGLSNLATNFSTFSTYGLNFLYWF